MAKNPFFQGRRENQRNAERRAAARAAERGNNRGGGGGGGGNNGGNKNREEVQDPTLGTGDIDGNDDTIGENENTNWATTNPLDYFKGYQSTYNTSGDSRFTDWFNNNYYDQMHTSWLADVMSVGGSPTEDNWKTYLQDNLNSTNVNKSWNDYFADAFRGEATNNRMRQAGLNQAGDMGSGFGKWLGTTMSNRLQSDWEAQRGANPGVTFNDYLNNQMNSGAMNRYYNNYMMDPTRWQQTYSMGRWQAF